jgi:hypothetical protein
LVTLESMFGNTRSIAEAVAEGLSSRFRTDLVEVGIAPTRLPEEIRLVVVGGPTHAFGMTRPRTREDAARQTDEPLVSGGRGLREWLEAAERPRSRPPAASFDTRIDRPRVPGSAARGAEKRLRRLGFPIAAPAESFYVGSTTGPLVDGELDRARRWGHSLAERVPSRATKLTDAVREEAS